jgi:CubicO group peptidase (beta-lactamase class C family)
MKLLNVFSLLFILTCFANPGFCQQQRIDSMLNKLHENHNLNGNVLVAEKGNFLYKKSFGYANTEAGKLNNDSTRFQLASIGKTFTAVAILQLKEKGKIKLDDPVAKYLPDFPFAGVTIGHLLSHTSGLPDLQIFDPYVAERPEIIIDNSLVIPALKRSGKLNFTPGERWSYSNAGYSVLALVIEKVSKIKFMDYLAKNIWKPSGMNSTYPHSLPFAKPDPLRAESYRMPIYSYQLQKVDTMKKFKALLVNFGGLQGPGFIASTTQDLLNFDSALYNGKLLKPETLIEAYTPVKLKNGEDAVVEPGKLSFGLGWFILNDVSKGKIVSHSGFIPGGATIFIRNITTRQTVILLDNAESDGLHTTGGNVMNILVGRKLLPQKKSLVKVYVTDLLKSGADYAAHFQELKADTAGYRFSSGEMDYAAHELNANGYKTQSLEASKLLTFIDPGAWQTYNSYGELLMSNGKITEAKAMFRKSLAINPDNHFAKDVLSKSPSN